MKVIFVILNYKTYTETIRLTSELIAEGLKDKFVLIVDNASPNESYQELSTQFKGLNTVEVIQSPENGGYAKGNNYGLRYAKKYNPEYVCIINNDVHFTMETIDHLCKWYEKLPNVAFIAPRQMLPNGKEAIFRCMDVPTLRSDIELYNPFSKKRHNLKENANIDNIHQIGLIPGAFIFTSYRKFEELGFFDESTFLFCEERFIAKVAQKRGLNNYIILNETYLHNHSTTINNEATKKKQRKMIYEGRCKYHKKFSSHPLFSLVVLSFAYQINEFYQSVYKVAKSIYKR